MNASRPIDDAPTLPRSPRYESTHTPHHRRRRGRRAPPTGHRVVSTLMTVPELDDDTVLAELRAECARWEQRDELEGGFARLFELRDEALRRGLPLPMSCPLDTPAS